MSSLEASSMSPASAARGQLDRGSDGAHSHGASSATSAVAGTTAMPPPSTVQQDSSLDQYLPRALQQFSARQDSAQAQVPGHYPGRPGSQSLSEWIASLTPEQQHDLHQQGLLDRGEVDSSVVRAMRAADDHAVGAAHSGPQAGMLQAPRTPPLDASRSSAAACRVGTHDGQGMGNYEPAGVEAVVSSRGEWEGGHNQRRLKATGPDEHASGGYLPTGVLQGWGGDDVGMGRRRRGPTGDAGQERVFSSHGGLMMEGQGSGRAWDSRHGTAHEYSPNSRRDSDGPSPAPVADGAVPQHALEEPPGSAAGSTALYLASLGAGGRTDVGLNRQSSAVDQREVAFQHAQVLRLQSVQKSGETLSDRGASSPALDGLPTKFRESM